MKKQIYREIEIPEGIEINLDGNEVTVQGKEGKIIKRMHLGKSEIEKKDGKIIIGGDKITKKEKKLINTTVAHIKNAILGVKEKFEYKGAAGIYNRIVARHRSNIIQAIIKAL